MKLSAGVLFMLVALLIGVAALAGGEVWVLSGSVALAWIVGACVLAVLATGFRLFLRRANANLSVRFLGEASAGVDEADFTAVSEAAAEARHEIERGVRRRPDKVAGSIRTMLGKGGSRVAQDPTQR